MYQVFPPVFADTDRHPDDGPRFDREPDHRTTRAIAVLVHIYGMPCDMDPINATRSNNGIAVEDARCAWLADYKAATRHAKDLGCFSFQNSKHIPAGEGGAAITGQRDEPLLTAATSSATAGVPTTFDGNACSAGAPTGRPGQAATFGNSSTSRRPRGRQERQNTSTLRPGSNPGHRAGAFRTCSRAAPGISRIPIRSFFQPHGRRAISSDLSILC